MDLKIKDGGEGKILKTMRPEFEFEGVDDCFVNGVIDSYDLTMLVSRLQE